MKFKSATMALVTFFLMCVPAMAGDDTLSRGDTAWVMVSAALVMMMTPAGLALFYGGMSRYKNLLNTLAMSFVAYCLVSVVWVLWGYSLSFGEDIAGILGGLEHLGLRGMDISSMTGTIPTFVFVVFQMTFACISVALISGSVVDRMKFSSWIVFSLLWVTFVYSPVAHWVWGGGWMHKSGAIDFAGGNVVHINAGVAGLVLSMMLGRRHGFGREKMFPSSIAFTVMGAALLWFGWFGFNAGSRLAADGVAASAFLVTNTSAAMGALGWMAVEWIRTGKPTVLGLASGAVAGLVAITPAAGYVHVPASMLMGVVSGIIGFYSVTVLKHRLGYDDSLDAFGVHGMCGVWGALAVGIFAEPVLGEGVAGVLYGNPGQLWIQFVSVVATAAFSAVATYVVVRVTGVLTGGIRIEHEQEIEGIDSAVHGERGFELI